MQRRYPAASPSEMLAGQPARWRYHLAVKNRGLNAEDLNQSLALAGAHPYNPLTGIMVSLHGNRQSYGACPSPDPIG